MDYDFKRPRRPVHSIFLHCSATDKESQDNPEFIRDVHVKENGWNDIGYHYFINKAGDLFTCRNIESTPAAQYQFNSGSIAICLSGLENFTDMQFATLEDLLHKIQDKYKKRLRIRGHREVAFLVPKDCPVYDYAKILNLKYEGESVETIQFKGKTHTIRSPIYYLRPENITETPEVKGITVAAGSGGVAVAAEILQEIDLAGVAEQVQVGTSIAGGLSVLIGYGPIVLGIIALIALSYAFYKFRDRIKL